MLAPSCSNSRVPSSTLPPGLTETDCVLVKPRVLPKVTARLAGGRPTPGGEIDVEAKLVDESGAPLAGSVTGVVFDRFAAVDDGIPPDLDTRLMLCGRARVARHEDLPQTRHRVRFCP